MTCKHCCGADQFFDLPTATKEMKSYLKKGTAGVTKRLVKLLGGYELAGRSLLDIGGGIGAIQWHFHENGTTKTTDVDASGGYLQVAREHAIQSGWEEKSYFLEGDFIDVADKVDPHDFVTLDKVICCYPDYEKLLELATSKSNKVLVLSFPIGGFLATVIAGFAALYFRIKKSPFRPYIHPPQKVLAFIESRGFVRAQKHIVFPWHAWAFERVGEG